MKINYKLYILVWILLSFFSSYKVEAQEGKSVRDSVKTLNILKETLNEVLEENKVIESGGVSEIEIDGLIMDQTITKVGRDFYDLYYSLWVAPAKANNYTISVKEMVLPGLATEISILVNESEVFRQRVQPRYEIMEEMAKYANQMTIKYLENYEKMNAQLEDEDQQGTGIF